MILSELTNLEIIGSSSVEIKGLSEDSRKIKSGFLFIATPGTAQDGRKYIKNAIENGAAAVLVSEDTDDSYLNLIKDKNIALIKTKDIRTETYKLAAAFYPKQPDTIVAITGTSGKTSTVQFVRELNSLLGYKSASIGTIGVVYDDFAEYGSLTSPDAITLHKTLNDVANKGITHVAFEASSHGIELKRVEAVKIKAGAFTNLSRDHLDYHKTMEEYFKAKLGLFERLIPPGGHAVLN